MKKKVILSEAFIPEAVAQLRERYDLIIAAEEKQEIKAVLSAHPDAVALISFLSDTVDRETIDVGKNLKIISNYAVGYNNIDVEYAKERGIWVSNTPDVLTDATADIAMSLILAVARRIVESDSYMRNKQFSGWGANLMLGKELYGAEIGIVGMGRIGTATAIRAMGFGMSVSYFSKHRKPDLESSLGFRFRPLNELIESADILSLHVPFTPEMHHLIGKAAFDRMKDDAIFINVSRGQLMDERALVDVLQRGKLFGAGLDVYEYEPKVTEALYRLNNVVLTPHIGSATGATRLKMARMNIEDIDRVLAGNPPKHPVW